MGEWKPNVCFSSENIMKILPNFFHCSAILGRAWNYFSDGKKIVLAVSKCDPTCLFVNNIH